MALKSFKNLTAVDHIRSSKRLNEASSTLIELKNIMSSSHLHNNKCTQAGVLVEMEKPQLEIVELK